MSDGNLETYETVKVREHSFFFLFCLSDGVQHLHKILPAFTPYVPVGVLAYLAFILLTATFGLAFYFTTYVVVVSIFYHRPIFFGSQHLEINHPYARGGSCYRSQHTRWLWHCSSLLFRRSIRVAKSLSANSEKVSIHERMGDASSIIYTPAVLAVDTLCERRL